MTGSARGGRRPLVGGWARTGSALVVAALVATGTGLAAGVLGPVSAAVVVAVSVFACAKRWTDRSGAEPTRSYGAGGLAAVIDDTRHHERLTVPMAVIVVEVRGLAADTIVEGAQVWSGPLAVLGRRLANAIDDSRVARIGPHSFGVAVSLPDTDVAVAVGERLVAACRQPIPTGFGEVRVDAVAGVCHRHVGEPVTGEEMIREADASLRLGPAVASPVVAVDKRLRSYALRVMAVESEIRDGLDADLLVSKLVPVVDVREDRIVLFRSSPDWTGMSLVEPGILSDVASSLGLRRSIDSQFLLSSISATDEAARRPGEGRVLASIDAARLTDSRAVSQIRLLLDVVGLAPEQLVVELDRWSMSTLETSTVEPLVGLGIGIGMTLHHRGRWQTIPAGVAEHLVTVSVEIGDLLYPDGRLALERIESLRELMPGGLAGVLVLGVDDAPSALELSAAGLT
ncbi:MAG: hypothetical protein ACE5GB_14700, partial [Acidimicrobiales bacterium]